MDLAEPPTRDSLPVYYARAVSSDISEFWSPQCHLSAVALGLLKAGLGGPSREYSAINFSLSAGVFRDSTQDIRISQIVFLLALAIWRS